MNVSHSSLNEEERSVQFSLRQRLENIHLWFEKKERAIHLGLGKCIDKDDIHLLFWPLRSPDLTPCDFYLWGHVKDCFVPPLPENLPELRARIINSIAAIDMDTLGRVWDELDYWLDVCRVTREVHIEHL
ncbi:hypothetical protein ANN_20173 [Periplaneta americana]|uniref:Uncharacterized protein n=1 Tax=Periplaneta americana TaxID=6978 RepID=A0ABQ8SBX4_PERAM|nr:hypothetical protein ANN_20173 [Periplaneta americana]